MREDCRGKSDLEAPAVVLHRTEPSFHDTSAAELHQLQQAWIDLDFGLCGNCRDDQILGITALLAELSNPTDAQIDAAMSGGICPCATYNRILAATYQVSGAQMGSAGDTGAGG